MRLIMVPDRLDGDVSRFVIELNGESFDYRHGPRREWSIKWPGEGFGVTRIMFEEANGGRPTVVEEGPWSFFRLLDDSTVVRQSDIQYTATFTAGGKSIDVLLQASSVRNPLARRDLHNFSCASNL
jgi:type VI secretion system protein ImpL